MRRRARWILIGMLLLLAVGAFLFWPAPPMESGPLPNPNGCDDFATAGALVQRDLDYQILPEPDLRQLVSTNAMALKKLRAGLDHECRVRMEYSADFSKEFMATVVGNKALAWALMAEGRLAEMEHRTNEAARSYLDAIRLGHESARGGLLIHHLVGIACESMGAQKLAALVPALEAQECRAVIGQLESIAAKRESSDDTLRLERAWSRRVANLKDRIVWRITSRSFDPTKQIFDTSYLPRLQAEIARQSGLLLDLATRAYTLEKGKPPSGTNELMPAYLKALP